MRPHELSSDSQRGDSAVPNAGIDASPLPVSGFGEASSPFTQAPTFVLPPSLENGSNIPTSFPSIPVGGFGGASSPSLQASTSVLPPLLDNGFSRASSFPSIPISGFGGASSSTPLLGSDPFLELGLILDNDLSTADLGEFGDSDDLGLLGLGGTEFSALPLPNLGYGRVSQDFMGSERQLGHALCAEKSEATPSTQVDIPQRVTLDEASIVSFLKSDFFSKYPGMKKRLAAHQLYAIKWLKDTMDQFNNHAVLADGTGLGKTYSALGLVAYLHFCCDKAGADAINNILILVPSKAIMQWEQEINKFMVLTDFKFILEQPRKRKKTAHSSKASENKNEQPNDGEVKTPKITLMSSESVSFLKKPFEENSFDLVLVDEFHSYSTAEKFFKNIEPIVDKPFLALTATPFRNHVERESRKWERCGFSHLSRTTLRRIPENIEKSGAQLKIPNLIIKPVSFDLTEAQRNITRLIAQGIIIKELRDIGFFFNVHLLRRFAIAMQSLSRERLEKIEYIVSKHDGIISKATWIRLQALIRPVKDLKNEAASSKVCDAEDEETMGDASEAEATSMGDASASRTAGMCEEQCPVCLDKIDFTAGVVGEADLASEAGDKKEDEATRVTVTNCGHFFHEACLSASPQFKDVVGILKAGDQDRDSLIEFRKKELPKCFVCRTPVALLKSIEELRETLVSIDSKTSVVDNKMAPKIEFLLNYIEKNPEESILVAAPYREVLFYLEDLFKGKKISFINLSGPGTKNKKNEKVRSFQEGDVKICMLTIAMGESLNLQKASSLFLLGPHTSVVKETQMIGRVWRMGSPHKNVTVYRLTSNGTVEKDIVNQNIIKSEQIQHFYDGLATPEELQKGIKDSTVNVEAVEQSLKALMTSSLSNSASSAALSVAAAETLSDRKKGKQKARRNTRIDSSFDDDWETTEICDSRDHFHEASREGACGKVNTTASAAGGLSSYKSSTPQLVPPQGANHPLERWRDQSTERKRLTLESSGDCYSPSRSAHGLFSLKQNHSPESKPCQDASHSAGEPQGESRKRIRLDDSRVDNPSFGASS